MQQVEAKTSKRQSISTDQESQHSLIEFPQIRRKKIEKKHKMSSKAFIFMMTLMLLFFYSSNQEGENNLVKIGGLPSIRNPFGRINKIHKKIAKLRMHQGEKGKDTRGADRKIVKIVTSVNKFGPQKLEDLISKER